MIIQANPATGNSPSRRWRILGAGAAAWLMGSFAGAAVVLADGQAPLRILFDPGVLLLVVIIPLYGLVVGWIPLAMAFAAWGLLHALRWTGPWIAAAVGAVAGALAPVCAGSLVLIEVGGPGGARQVALTLAATALAGAAIGLVTRRIAYPRSVNPRQP